MNMKKVIISLACCAFVAPLAFGQGPTATEQGVTVTGTSPASMVEGGEAARYQPRKTLVVHNQGAGHYVLNGPGHVFNSRGDIVRSGIRPGTRVHVYFANYGGVKTVDRVVVD
jgi:hypothetical protein